MQYKTQHLNPEQIARVADAINSGTYDQIPENMRNHLLECDDCASEVINVTELSFNTRNISYPFKDKIVTTQQKNVKKINSKTIIGFAAAATIISFAILFNIPWNDSETMQSIKETPKVAKSTEQNNIDSTPQIAEEKQIKKNQSPLQKNTTKKTEKQTKKTNQSQDNKLLAYYKPNPNIEKLYENMQGNYRGESIEVTTLPEIKYTKGTKLEWKNPDKHTLYVELFDNSGEKIKEITTNDTSYHIPMLQPGLYYWKLINENYDLLFVGKIIVK